MRDPLRWPRRALTIPGVLLGALATLALLPAVLPLAAALDLARRGPDLLLARGALVVTYALGCEAVGVLAALVLGLTAPFATRAAWLRWHHALQRAWCGALLSGLCRLYRVRLRVEGRDALGPGPLLCFMRHTSVADTLLPAVLVPWRLRFVLKHELLWDPCLDLVGQRLQNAFVRREGAAADVELVRALGRDLGPEEGVLIYPEGTRFTPQKRLDALLRLVTSNPDLAARARALTHTLPPRLGGPLALLESAAPADVVFIAHVGLDGLAGPGSLLRGALLDARVQVLMWRAPRSEIPTREPERIDWLYTQWARVDAWVSRASATLPEA